MRTLQVLAALLTYPSSELQAVIADLRTIVKGENLLPPAEQEKLLPLFQQIEHSDLLGLEENYVLLFDRTRSLSLHLFEHVHGESRDRGQAMVDLRNQYAQAGLEIDSNELPDYIPMFLEYLSTLRSSVAREQLAMCAHILAALAERLQKQQSAYAAVFHALVWLASAKPNAQGLSALISQAVDDPQDLQAIDQLWEEQAVSFRPDAQTCGPNTSSTVQAVQFDAKS